MTHEQGCSSHACLITPPKGMGTNSGKCYCPQEFVRKHITTLRAEVERLTKRKLITDVVGLENQLNELKLSIISERKAIESEMETLVHKFRHEGYVPTNDIERLGDRILAGEYGKEKL